MRTTLAILQALPLFEALDAAALGDLAAALDERRYRPGQHIVFEGDPSQGVFVILEGRVRLARTAADGREQVLDTAGPGEMFNVVPLVDAGPAPATARAMAPLRCLHLPAAALSGLIRRHPELALVLLRTLAAQVRDLSVLLEDLAFRSVRARLARILLHEAEDGTAALTHQELASRAGTVREIIGRTLRQMAEEGLVELARGNVVVLDVEGLRRIGE
ncbi:MAG TPA: Crp/Fnr family transcriptional regulator [Herpetosiphonaceae bacterium]